MKRIPMKTIVATLLLIITFSCTKENINTKPVSVSAATSENAVTNDSIYIGAKYQGGIIFWIDETGLHGLIAARNNIGDSTGTQWATDPKIVTGATKQVIGSGANNTRKIINALGTTSTYAALLCADFHDKGYNDWFLPSIGELQQLMAQKDVVGGFPADNFNLYASSTEAKTHSTEAMGISYQNSTSIALERKDNLFNVRPVRRF